MRKSIIFILAFSSCFLSAQTPNSLTLHLNDASTVINKEIYGHFAEHLGRCVYGGIYVSDTSGISNVNGYRTDVVEALKELKIPVLRWPGGCFADTYHWKDGIGPLDARPSIVNVFWGGVTENNSFGTHEFLDLCELLESEAYISLNVGSGTVQESSEWVEYVTSSNISPMTDLRKTNGRQEPWHVKYWGIGNESWGCGGDLSPEYYGDLYRRFASYARGAEYKIACGANSWDVNWTDKVMAKTQNKQHLMQGLSLHYYTVTNSWENKGSAIDFDDREWFETLRKTLRMQELIDKHEAVMRKYDPNNKVAMIVDEWGMWSDVEEGTNPGFLYQQNTLRDALVAGINLNIFNNNADVVKMANIAQVVNVLQSVILTKGNEMVLTPTYHVFNMYKVHQGATLVPIDLNCIDFVHNEQAIPSLNASASIKDEVLSITVCNLDPNTNHLINIDLDKEFAKASGQIITANTTNAYNDFGKEEMVSLEQFRVKSPKKGVLSLEIPAKSVVLIQLR